MGKQKNNKGKPQYSVSALSKKMYLDLSNTERKFLRKHFFNFKPSFTINPFAIADIQKNTNFYVLFIDARINSCYLKVKELLEKNKHKFSSYSSIGDADFILEYIATEAMHNRIKKEIYDLLGTAPKEKPGEKLIESFKISKTFILKGSKNDYSARTDYELSDDDIPKISQIQSDYSNNLIIQGFGGQNKIKKFLTEIREKQIILGYYSLGESIKPTIKAYVLLLYSITGYEHFILRDKSISNKIVDFYSIKIDSGDDEFYKQANFLITAEFSSISEYHEWKEMLYKLSKENEYQINVMTFIIEHAISEVPIGIGNYGLFDEIAKYYNSGYNNKLIFGHPFYLDEIKQQYNICISLDTLKENGFIIGEPGTGKTYTAMVLAKKIFDKKKRVHIVDCSGGISEKFNEVFPDISTEIIKNVDVTDFENGFYFSESNNIFFYQPQKNKYSELVIQMLNRIVGMNNPDEKRTTNDVIIFEEAHLILKDETTVKAISECITISGRKGFSIWLSTQKLSHIPTSLHSNLRNRIIHKVDIAEKGNIASLLLSSIEECLYDDLEKEVTSLKRGEAIVSFVFPKNNTENELSPIKINIVK